VFKLVTYGYEPPVTDASKPNKRYSSAQNVRLRLVHRPIAPPQSATVEFEPIPTKLLLFRTKLVLVTLCQKHTHKPLCLSSCYCFCVNPLSHGWYIWHTFLTCEYLPRRGNGALVKNIGHLFITNCLSNVTQFTGSTNVIIHFAFSLFLYTCPAEKWRVCVCVWTVSNGKYVGVWPSMRAMGKRSHWPGKNVASVPQQECLPDRPVVGTAWELFTWHLVHCICKIYPSWEQRLSYES
jgi:hypothetical protein